jgi:hypothetical protein
MDDGFHRWMPSAMHLSDSWIVWFLSDKHYRGLTQVSSTGCLSWGSLEQTFSIELDTVKLPKTGQAFLPLQLSQARLVGTNPSFDGGFPLAVSCVFTAYPHYRFRRNAINKFESLECLPE